MQPKKYCTYDNYMNTQIRRRRARRLIFAIACVAGIVVGLATMFTGSTHPLFHGIMTFLLTGGVGTYIVR